MANKKEVIIDADPERQKALDYIEIQKNKRSNLIKKEKPIINDVDLLKGAVLADIKEDINEIKIDIVKSMNLAAKQFSSMKDLKGFMITAIQEEVKSQISNTNLHSIVNDILSKEIKEKIYPISLAAVKSYGNALLKSVEYQSNRTKELIQSTNQDIKHLLRELPISYNEEQEVRKLIEKKLETFTPKKKFKLIETGGK